MREKEQRNRRWRRGRAWCQGRCQGRRSHEDRRASSKRGSWGRGPPPECSSRSCLSTTVKPGFIRVGSVELGFGSDRMEWNGFGCLTVKQNGDTFKCFFAEDKGTRDWLMTFIDLTIKHFESSFTFFFFFLLLFGQRVFIQKIGWWKEAQSKCPGIWIKEEMRY